MLRSNDFIVVVSKHPAAVKFLDPIPSSKDRGKIEQAAIQLSRKILHREWGHIQQGPLDHTVAVKLFVECLIHGTALDENGSTDEQLDNAYLREKTAEYQRLARADAKAERDAKKKAEQKKET